MASSKAVLSQEIGWYTIDAPVPGPPTSIEINTIVYFVGVHPLTRFWRDRHVREPAVRKALGSGSSSGVDGAHGAHGMLLWHRCHAGGGACCYDASTAGQMAWQRVHVK
jgi:hypothetical protein